jgi:hypothetical protein
MSHLAESRVSITSKQNRPPVSCSWEPVSRQEWLVMSGVVDNAELAVTLLVTGKDVSTDICYQAVTSEDYNQGVTSEDYNKVTRVSLCCSEK